MHYVQLVDRRIGVRQEAGLDDLNIASRVLSPVEVDFVNYHRLGRGKYFV